MTPQTQLQANSPSYESSAYSEQMADWTIVNDCAIGQSAIKAKKGTYLPQNEKERDKSYAIRLNRSAFWNVFKRTRDGLVGMVFRKNPQLDTDVPQIIAGDKEKKNAGGYAENIDLRGSHLDVFSKEVFKWAINDGHCFILVDMPPPVTAENPEATLATEKEAGIRPYWVLIRKNQIKNWRTSDENGAIELEQVTICETVTEPNGLYGEKQIEQYRVLRPGSWEIWRRNAEQLMPESWSRYQSGVTSLDFIPLVIVSANETGFMTSSPPLLDLAHENITHYQLRSDVRNILHYACVPLLTEDIGEATHELDQVNPDGTKKELTISPNTLRRLGKGGKLEYVEPRCTGVDHMQKEIETTVKNMAVLGLTLLAARPTVQSTATENVLDFEAETSELASMARNLEDGLEQALEFTAKYINLPTGGSVKVNKQFARLGLDASLIVALANMVAADEYPLETLWDYLAQAELWPANLSHEEAKKMIAAEIAKRQSYAPLPTRGALKDTTQPIAEPGKPPTQATQTSGAVQ